MAGSRSAGAARTFCGRDRELRHLQRAYGAVAAGEPAGPRLVALVAESGLGKTRVVQEFFGWLSTSQDAPEPDGYWPDALTTLDNNLQLNPDPAACNNRKPVPFLWWGLRLADPGARNQAVTGQLASSIDTFTPHLEPVYRTRRRKAGRKGIGVSLGKAAADLVVDLATDLIPLAGVFKTLGETVWEMGQNVRTLWKDDIAATGQLLEQQREDLAARIVSDLGLLLSRESDDIASVPVIIVIDDGQFSTDDPSIVTFLDRMLAASIANRWRVLFVVTYWTAEWHRHFAADARERTVAQVIRSHIGGLGDGWEPTFLGPVADLSPIVAAALPGLEPVQAVALVERAGGNPRYLDEILRYCERNPRLFVGRRLDGPLTPQGLETLMEKTVDLHELVEERLQELEPEVRRAVILASVQGQEFVEPLVTDLARLLDEPADETALQTAEHPHAFIHRQPGRLGAFTQRIFHEVAVAQIPNEFDEGQVDEALRAAIRRRLDEGEAVLDDEPSARRRTCVMGVRLFAESDDEDDRLRAAFALAVLVRDYEAQHDYELANRFAVHLAAVLRSIDVERPHFFLYHVAAEALRNDGRFAEALELLDLVIPRERTRVAGDPDGPARLCLLLKESGLCARAQGDLVTAEERFREALEIDRRSAAETPSPRTERNLMVSLGNVGHMAEIRGDLGAAERDFAEAHAIAVRLDERERTDQTREDLAVTIVSLADIAAARGDAGRAEALFRESLSIEGPTIDPASDPARAMRRALVLERIGQGVLDRGNVAEADELFLQALDLRRRAVERMPSVDARINLSNLLRMIGDVAKARDDWMSAVTAWEESLQIVARVFDETGSPVAANVVSLAFERLGVAAIACDAFDRAAEIFEYRLSLDRPLAEAQRTPKAWRNVMNSVYWLADVAEQRGDLETAERSFLEALDIARAIDAHVGSPSAREDLRPILRRLAQLARKRGDEATARAHEAEMAALFNVH